MSGGLVQLTATCEEDYYLHKDPEITFFKKKHKNHTKFSLEIKEIELDHSFSYGEKYTIDIPHLGDLLNRVYFEVNIPVLNITDSLISDSDYTSYKNTKLTAIQTKIDFYSDKYNKLLNFCNIEFIYYQKLLELINSENVTISNLQAKVTSLNTTYGTDRTTYFNLLDTTLSSQINIAGYITALVGAEVISTIKSNIIIKYNLADRYLKYYYYNKIYQDNLYTDVNTGKLSYGWSEYLGHYYINNFQFELGGKIIDNYDSDQLHIFQSHNIDKSKINNYEEMIGHESINYEFSNETRTEKKIHIPLIFWFCRNSFNSLPLISMKKTAPRLTFTINKLKNIIFFNDWENRYNKLLTIDIPLDDHSLNTNGSVVKFSDLEYSKVKILYPEYIYRYTCTKMNKKLLDLQFSGIDSQSVLDNYGNGSYLTLNNWMILMKNLKTDTLLSSFTKQTIGGYHYFINYDTLSNLVPSPSIKFFAEYVYLDHAERCKFEKKKLGYLVEFFSKTKLDIGNTKSINNKIKENFLCSKMYIYVKPKLYTEGIVDYGKMYNGKFNNQNFYDNKILDSIEFFIGNQNIMNRNLDLFYNKLKSYQYLNNNLLEGVYFYNFNMYPEEYQPSGSYTFSDVLRNLIKINLNSGFLSEYFDNIENDNNEKSINKNSHKLEFNIVLKNYNILMFDNQSNYLVFNDK